MEDLNLKDKLYEYSEKPRSTMWDSIAGALDLHPQISKKLLQYEEAPPARIWQQVEASLTSQRAKVIPFSTKYKRHFKYGIAASLFFLIIAASYFTLNNKETVSAPTAQVVQKIDNEPQQTIAKKVENETTIVSNTPSVNKKQSIVKPATTAQKILKYLKPQTLTTSISAPKKLVADVTTSVQQIDFKMAERLMVYPDLNGKPVRLSKKLFEVVNCDEGDLSCKHNVQNLQEKVSNATLTADFFGFLEIIKQVQEK